jgi:hypothetical protein
LELFVGILFGVVGSAYLLYGKRQREAWFILTGFALIIFPYFVSGVFLTLLVGGVLLVFPIAKHNEWF